MKILQFKNESLLELVTTEAILKAPSVAGASISLVIDDNTGMVNSDYVLLGEIGKGRTEIAKINTAVTRGATIVVDTLVFPHPAGTPVRRIPYNQVKFYIADTLAGDKTELGSAVAIDVEKEYTSYEDSVNSVGFGFFALYNSTTTVASGYSAGMNYADAPATSREKIREFVTSPHNWNKNLDDATFASLCDFAESEIFAIKRWRFREAKSVFQTEASKQSYTLAEANASDLGQLVFATYDGYPIRAVTLREHRILNTRSIQSGSPLAVCEFDGSLHFTPIPSDIKNVELF
jgi:hypothetical protein